MLVRRCGELCVSRVRRYFCAILFDNFADATYMLLQRYKLLAAHLTVCTATS